MCFFLRIVIEAMLCYEFVKSYEFFMLNLNN